MGQTLSEIVVIGGGVAGAAAARFLALWGHPVRLVTKPTAQLAPLAESIPPSCRKLFDLLGVTDAIDRASAVHSTGNTVWWGTTDTRREAFANGERGWQILASAVTDTLLDSARGAGVTTDHRRVTIEEIDQLDPSILVLDCTGRAGLIARARGWRVIETTLRSVALAGLWRHQAWPVADPTHTIIESYGDGWMWSVPVSVDQRYVAAMVDPRVSDLADAGARAVYLAEIGKAPRFANLTAGATLDGGPWGFDASMYHSTCYADERVLVVGDAGSFIDPLSSAGIKKALASAWLAAVAIHTALRQPAMRTVAFNFFAAREDEIYRSFRTLTRDHLAAAAAGHANPFWIDRAALDQQTPSTRAHDKQIAVAFERIRDEPSLRLVRAPDVRIEPRPAVSGCEIVLEPRLVLPGAAAIRYQNDVDMVTLIEVAPQYDDVGVVLEAYTRRSGPVALPDFLRALATAVASGWLVWRH